MSGTSFLLMPDEDRSGTRRIEVTYADAMTMSRSLMVQLRRVRWEGSQGCKGGRGASVLRSDRSLLGLSTARGRPLPSWVGVLGQVPD